MSDYLRDKANEIIAILDDIPEVICCTIYGSLSTNSYDELSDIDIEVDVSGTDNGQFMIRLVEILKNKCNVYYYDYAPSLIPEHYIVSIAIDEHNPFLLIDLKCSAIPHCTTVTRRQVNQMNNKFTHLLKLWTANLKHYSRGVACYEDILHMAHKLPLEDIDAKGEIELLEDTLCWFEDNVNNDLQTFVASCRNKFNKLIRDGDASR